MCAELVTRGFAFGGALGGEGEGCGHDLDKERAKLLVGNIGDQSQRNAEAHVGEELDKLRGGDHVCVAKCSFGTADSVGQAIELVSRNGGTRFFLTFDDLRDRVAQLFKSLRLGDAECDLIGDLIHTSCRTAAFAKQSAYGQTNLGKLIGK